MAKSIQERVKHLETIVKSCCNRFFKLKEEVDSLTVNVETVTTDLETLTTDFNALVITVDGKAEAPIVVPNITVTTSGWTLVSGVYEKVISNANILAASVVYIVPENSALDIIQNAEMYPKTLSGVGTVTIYAKTIPTGSFIVNLNIFN